MKPLKVLWVIGTVPVVPNGEVSPGRIVWNSVMESTKRRVRAPVQSCMGMP